MISLPLSFFFCFVGSIARASEFKTPASVVTSDEWVVRRSPVREDEFTGNVRYKAGPHRFESDWALFNHETELWKARGRIRLRRDFAEQGVLHAEGEESTFSQKTERGRLTGPKGATFRRETPELGADEGRAARLEWEGRERALLTGAVRTWGPRLESWSDSALYENAQRRLTLDGGRPVALKREGLGDPDLRAAMQADRIVVRRDENGTDRLEGQGRARGWLVFPRRGEAK